MHPYAATVQFADVLRDAFQVERCSSIDFHGKIIHFNFNNRVLVNIRIDSINLRGSSALRFLNDYFRSDFNDRQRLASLREREHKERRNREGKYRS